MSDASIKEHLDHLRFFQTPEHECSYLADRDASTVFVDPHADVTPEVYSQLAQIGFRRSGPYLYRPRCNDCQSCIAIRLPVEKFTMNRSQRRAWKKNSDLKIIEQDTEFSEEHYALYEKYLKMRHAGGGMDDATPQKYKSFLSCEWMTTRYIEFRKDKDLVGVAVTDYMTDGLSALYTFFDPEYKNRSIGTFAILWQIEAARVLNLPWLYLGYWIEECEKMSYKTQYLPYEVLINGRWVLFERQE